MTLPIILNGVNLVNTEKRRRLSQEVWGKKPFLQASSYPVVPKMRRFNHHDMAQLDRPGLTCRASGISKSSSNGYTQRLFTRS